jgi:hypothetical protein
VRDRIDSSIFSFTDVGVLRLGVPPSFCNSDLSLIYYLCLHLSLFRPSIPPSLPPSSFRSLSLFLHPIQVTLTMCCALLGHLMATPSSPQTGRRRAVSVQSAVRFRPLNERHAHHSFHSPVNPHPLDREKSVCGIRKQGCKRASL